jgi:hypothetical protein
MEAAWRIQRLDPTGRQRITTVPDGLGRWNQKTQQPAFSVRVAHHAVPKTALASSSSSPGGSGSAGATTGGGGGSILGGNRLRGAAARVASSALETAWSIVGALAVSLPPGQEPKAARADVPLPPTRGSGIE